MKATETHEEIHDKSSGNRRVSGIGTGGVTGNGKKRDIVLLVLLFISALLIRGPGLGRWCLTVDEFYFTKAVSFIQESGLPVFPGGGYYIRGIGLQYLSVLPVSLIENLECAVRIIPLLFGAMTIPLFFLFCRKFLGDAESLLCAVILLLSSWHIELSRFARMYMPFQFLFFLFLYLVHSGFRENSAPHRKIAWIVAALSVLVYEGSVIPALLLAALVLTGDVGRTGKGLACFTALFLALIALNLAANLVDYRSMGVIKAELVRHASPQGAWTAGNYPVVLPDLGLLAFAYRSWSGKAILAIFACAGAYLTARSAKRYEGPFPKAILLVSLAPLPVLPMMHQYGILAALGVIIAMNRKDIRLAVEKDLLPWGIYLLLTLAFWTLVAAQSGNLDRIRHFLIGYPPARYAMVEPFLRVIPLWMVFLLGTAVISILRNILFRKWEEDTFPVTFLVLCLVVMSVFRTRYRETRYSFFFFPLLLVVAAGEMRRIRAYLSETVWPAFTKRAGSLLLVIPLGMFLLTEDFHLQHVINVSSHELNFRTGRYGRFADHWYPRADLKTPGTFVGSVYEEGDVVVLEQVAMSQYMKKPFINYVGAESERFRGIARKGGTEEIWTGRPLISHPRQLASKVPRNSHNSLWFIGVVRGFSGRTLDLATRQEELSREYGLVIDQVYVGTDGKIGVWRMRAGNAIKAADPGRRQHGAEERERI